MIRITNLLASALFFCAMALTANAQTIEIHHPYAISSSGPTGAGFFVVHNLTEEDDRLIGVRSDLARRTELHTHEENGEGVMTMRRVDEGFPIPAGGMLELKRGAHHVMFMGIDSAWEEGQLLPITLIFENAGEVELLLEVDNDRAPDMHGGHGDMDHDHSEHMEHSDS